MSLGIPPEFLKQIIQQAEQEYPRECCGLILGSLKNQAQYSKVLRCQNVQDEYHARHPIEFPRTSRNAYFLDPKELLSLQKRMRENLEEIRIIYHSHIDAPALFSEEDRRMAIHEGEPVYPNVTYLVLSVLKGKVSGYHIYGWDKEQRHFKLLEK